jgi:catechol 2,3-dioxygenase-like lactoylglutathione lyase family enzyme
MDMQLEVAVIPVSDVDRARRFYESLRFHLDIDLVASDNLRVVQLTPPGSDASIHIGKGISLAAPGSIQNLYLVVDDVQEARADLVRRGINVSEVFHYGGGQWRAPGPDTERQSYGSFVSFCDPDGNTWLVQEVKKRLPGRTAHELLTGEMTDILLETLKATAAAHGAHEKELGKPDPDWPRWYADHMTRTLVGSGRHLTGPSAGWAPGLPPGSTANL